MPTSDELVGLLILLCVIAILGGLGTAAWLWLHPVLAVPATAFLVLLFLAFIYWA